MLGKTALFASVLGAVLIPVMVAAATVPLGVNFEVAGNVADGLGGRPAIAFDGTNFLTVWRDSSGTIRGARITTAGTVLDPGGFAIGSGDGRPSVAFSDSDFLVIWVGSGEVHGARVTTGGTVASGPWAITTGGTPKIRDISLAFDGTNYLIAWRNSGDQIRAARVNTAGTILDAAAGIVLGTGFYPWVAFDGTNYLVVWYYWGNGLDIFGNRVATDGTVLDGSGFTIFSATGDQAHASVAFGGGVYLVVWHDLRGGNLYNEADARGVRVGTDGTVLDSPEIQISQGAHHQVPVNVAFDGTDFFVVWHMGLQWVDFRLSDVYGRRVSTAGGVLDEQAIPVSTAFGHQFGPRLGYGGGRHLVAWNDGFRCDSCLWAQLLDAVSDATTGAGGGTSSARSAELGEPTVGAGVTWTSEPKPAITPLQDVLGVDGDDIYAYGKDAAGLFHWDGSSWATITYPPPGGGFGLWASAPDDVWITGWCYHVSHYSNGVVNNPSCLNWPEPGLGLGILRLPSGALLTVGAPADAKYYDGPIDGWGTDDWVKLPLPRAVDLHDIWETPTHRVFAVGELGTVVEWDGAEWDMVPDVPTVQSLNAIWGREDASLFIVGDFGEILYFDGVSFTRQASGTLEHLFDVWGFGHSDVWAVGSDGTILHNDGGGWGSEVSGTDRMLMGLTRAGQEMLAVGDEGIFLSRAVTPYAPATDLAVTKDDGVEEAVPGEGVTYTIEVFNETVGAGLMAAAVSDTPPAALTCSWTCEPVGGATCALGPEVGDLSDEVELPEAARAVYRADCLIDAGATGSLSNTAMVATVPGVTELDGTDNSATDEDVLLALGACGKPDHRTLTELVIDSPTEVVACVSITAGPALDVTATGRLQLRAGDRVVFHNGVAIASSAVLEVEIDESLLP
jgi:hypothetical protein